MPGLAGRPVGRLAWRTVHATLESGIAKTALAALRDHLPFAVFGQIANNFAGIYVVYHRATWNPHFEVVAGATGHIAPRTTLAILGAKFSRHAKIGERIHRCVSDNVNAAAMAPIATVGSTALDIFFAAKTEAAVTAVAGLDSYGCFIDEFHRTDSI
jgi:hypothetical protein